MKLIALQAESFKRLRAVRINPGDGVTPIVGRNGQGKTSVIDAVASALGGAACAPTMPIRRGEHAAEVTVDLGDIKVRRRWTAKGSSLEVFSPDGAKYPSPQAVLDKLIGKLSFDPLEFSRLPAKQQARTLAEFAGVDLDDYAARRKAVFDERTDVNRQIKTARAQLDAMPVVEAPAEEVSVGELLKKLKEAGEHNLNVATAWGEVEKASRAVTVTLEARDAAQESLVRLLQQVKDTEAEISRLEALAEDMRTAWQQAKAAAEATTQINTDAIEEKLQQAEVINERVRAAKARYDKSAAVAQLEKQADALTAKLDLAEQRLAETITAAQLPVEGLALTPDGVAMNGIPLGDCSGAEKLRASVAVAIALNPKLKLMLIRDGSLLDSDGMTLLANMAESAGAQVLIERVDNGNEVGVRIVDGEVEELAVSPAPQSETEAPAPPTAAV